MFAEKDVSRRDFLIKASLIGGVVPLVLTACGGGTETPPAETETPAEMPAETPAETATDTFACTDTSGLTDIEKTQREGTGYVDISTMPDRNCLNCNFWQSGEVADSCGVCQVVKGPIHPKGYCNLWAAKAAG